MPINSILRRLQSIVVILFASLILAGCSSIPISTMLKMSSFDEQDFASLDPAQIRLRMTLPKGNSIDLDRTRFNIDVTVAGQNLPGQYQLTEINHHNKVLKGGWFSDDRPQVVYLFGLTQPAQQAFKKTQQFVNNRKVTDLSLDVTVRFNDSPAIYPGSTIRFSIEALLNPAQGYITLFDDAKVTFDQTDKQKPTKKPAV